jgi:hypothetical protein
MVSSEWTEPLVKRVLAADERRYLLTETILLSDLCLLTLGSPVTGHRSPATEIMAADKRLKSVKRET